MIGKYISCIMGELRLMILFVSVKCFPFFSTYNMEWYHLLYSFPELALVIAGLSNVNQVNCLDNVIIQRVCSCYGWKADPATV